MLYHTHILGIENISAVLVLVDREILALTGLFHQAVLPAARLGALSPVGITVDKIV